MIKWSSTELDSDTHTNTVFTEHWLGSFQQLVHSGLACAKGDVTTLELTHKQDHDNVHPLFHPFSPPSLSALPSLCNASYNTGTTTLFSMFSSPVCVWVHLEGVFVRDKQRVSCLDSCTAHTDKAPVSPANTTVRYEMWVAEATTDQY